MSTPCHPVDATARPVEHLCANSDDLASQLAHALAHQLRNALRARPTALLAVSGGRSPIALFQQLSQQPLDWARVQVLLADERCVPHGHADSNTTLVRQHLLQGAAAQACLIPFFETWAPDASPSDLARRANERLATLPWPLDALVLGMGDDGHTASLFPGAPGLAAALTSAGPVACTHPATAGHARLTLTLPVLCAARYTALSIAGSAKRTVYLRALQGPDAALPVSLVLHGSAQPVHVWLA